MKKISFKQIAFLILISSIFVLTGCSSNKKYKLTIEENVAWTGLRLAIAQSNLSGSSTTLTTKHIELLKNMTKKFNKNREWFSATDSSYIMYGKSKDTSEFQITSLCSEDYCATFKVKEEDNSYYLIDYNFDKAKDLGSELLITEKDSL